MARAYASDWREPCLKQTAVIQAVGEQLTNRQDSAEAQISYYWHASDDYQLPDVANSATRNAPYPERITGG